MMSANKRPVSKAPSLPTVALSTVLKFAWEQLLEKVGVHEKAAAPTAR